MRTSVNRTFMGARVGLVGTAVGGLLLLVWLLVRVEAEGHAAHARVHAIQQLVSHIDYLDEALTASARLAAVMKSPVWERRYHELSDELTTALGRMNAIAETAAEEKAVVSISAIAERLLDTQRRALALLKKDDRNAAEEMLFGSAYAADKRAYSDAAAGLLSGLQTWLDEEQRQVRRVRQLVLVLSALSLLGLLVLWRVTRSKVLRHARAQAEAVEKLRASEERQRALTENISDIISLYDADGRVLHYSPSYTRLLGHSVEQRLGGSAFDNIHPEDQARARAALAKAVSAPAASSSVVLRVGHKEGGYRTVEAKLTNLLHKPSVGAVLSIARDVTEREEAQRALFESEERLRQVAEHLSASIWICRADSTKMLYLSPASERIFGVPLRELYARELAWLDTVHPDDRAVILQRLERNVRERDTVEEVSEFRLLRPDGEVRWVRTHAFAIFDQTGTLYRVAGITEDITAEKRALTALQQREEHYRRLVTTSPDAIFALDVEGLFTELNPAGETLLQRSASEVVGRHFTEVIAPEDVPAAADIFHQIVSGQTRNAEVELRVRRLSGELRLVAVNTTAIVEDGVVLGGHGIARDITETRAAEEQLGRAERLASVGTLLSGVAHELNNPLATIGGFTALMLEEKRSDEDRESLETVHREAARAARIVADLRFLACKSQDDRETREAVDLHDVVQHVLKTRAYSLATQNIEVEQHLMPRLPAVSGDPARLEQVVMNLVVNAAQALGAVEGPRRISVQTSLKDGVVRFAVRDNGPGIAPHHQRHLFDPFFTTKAPGEGMGLGLSLVQRIVTEHGGEVHLQSRLGQGATFCVELPVAARKVKDRAPVASAAELPSSGSLRVLVVDDEPGIRRLLHRLLTRQGHVVEEATEGTQALKMIDAASRAYDVVFSDLRMPGLGGEALLARLRDRGDGLDKRLIFMTGDAGAEDAERLSAENVPLLHKPFDLASLRTLMQARARAAAPPS